VCETKYAVVHNENGDESSESMLEAEAQHRSRDDQIPTATPSRYGNGAGRKIVRKIRAFSCSMAIGRRRIGGWQTEVEQ
jgi:hypothetical protein